MTVLPISRKENLSSDGDEPDSDDESSLPFVEDYLPALLAQASKLISTEFHREVDGRGFL